MVRITGFNNEKGSRIQFFFCCLFIFALSLTIRVLYFMSLQEIRLYPDSKEYVEAAYKISYLSVDAARVPLYPVFIQVARHLLFWLPRELAVCIAQMTLSSVGMVLLLYLSRMLFQSYIKALLVTIFSALSIFVMNWDFLILTESLTIFLIVLLVLLWVQFLEKPICKYSTGIYLICLALLFTKPFYIVLPVVLFTGFLFFQLHSRQSKRYLVVHAAAVGAVFLLVLFYSLANYSQNGYWGISSVGSVNKMGKILQYNLQELSSDEKIKALIREEKEKKGTSEIEPVAFMQEHGLDKEYYKAAAEFSSEIIKKHPIPYIRKTFEFMGSERFLRSAIFADYNYNNYGVSWPENLKASLSNGLRINSFKFLFILLFIECLHTLFCMMKRNKNGWTWAGIDVLILYQVFMSIGGSHGEYHRLIAPVYILIFLIMFRTVFTVLDWGLNFFPIQRRLNALEK